MRQSLVSKQAGATEAGPQFSWLSLPGLCCQAAGGREDRADGVAAAWALLYTTAHILDAIQDGDPPDPWWEALGSGAAINVASGLLTSAWVVLSRLPSPPSITQHVAEDFQRAVLRMASGQHLDLTDPNLSLERAWAVAEAKSGTFFALACRCGARMAGVEEAVAAHYAEFGRCLGLIVQIEDDLTDLTATSVPSRAPTLPMAYSLKTGTPEAGLGLLREDATKLSHILDDSGASLYLATKVAWFRASALEALDMAGAASPARNRLSALICSLDPSAVPSG